VSTTYLDGPVINQETVEGLEGLGRSIGMVEDNVGDTTALATGSVGELNLLDLTNR
jgi:hypothetical protein